MRVALHPTPYTPILKPAWLRRRKRRREEKQREEESEEERKVPPHPHLVPLPRRGRNPATYCALVWGLGSWARPACPKDRVSGVGVEGTQRRTSTLMRPAPRWSARGKPPAFGVRVQGEG